MTRSFMLLVAVHFTLLISSHATRGDRGRQQNPGKPMQERGLLWKQQAEHTLSDTSTHHEAVPECDVRGDNLADKFSELSARTGLAGSDGQLCEIERETITVLTNLTCSSCDAVYGFIQQLLVDLGVTTQCCLANGSVSCSNATIKKTDTAKAYGYGFLMVAGICLMSLIGVLLLPFLKNNSKFNQIYPYANTLLVSLGTSALFCSAILHLLPEAIQIEQRQQMAFIWKGVVVIAGLYMFYLFDMILHAFNLDTHEPLNHDGPSRDAPSESDSEEKNSIGNHDGDLVNNSHSDTATAPLAQMEHHEKSKLISESEKAQGFNCRSIKPLAWTIICGNIVHNFSDGLTLGAAISQSLSLGVSAAIAIAFHEIPHELGNFAILLSAGFSWYMALLINFMLATTSVVGFFIGVAVGTESKVSTQWILTLAVGLFLYVALVNLLPELIHTNEKGYRRFCFNLMTNIGFFISFTVIVLIGVFEEQLNNTINSAILL